MTSPVIKKTLNLHKYSIRVSDFIANWKIIIPIVFSVAGMILGCMDGKGEGRLFLKITSVISEAVLKIDAVPLTAFLRYLLPPTALAVILFFLGMSAYGGFAVNFIPLGFSFAAGAFSYYMYDSYTLKGLAYCVMLVFPYAVMSLTALVLCCAESINMSELMLKSISDSRKFSDYSFRKYYIAYLKNYLLIIFASAAGTALTHLFGGLFSF